MQTAVDSRPGLAPADHRPLRRAGRALVALAGVGCLLVTSAVTVPRWLDPHSYRLVQLATAAPLGTLTAAGAAVLFGSILATRGAGRISAALATAMALGLLTLHLWWVAPLFTGGRAAAQPGQALTVMTQNFEYGSASDLADKAAAEDVDILVIVDLTHEQFEAVMGSSIPRRFAYSDGTRPDAPSHTLVFSRYPLALKRWITPGGSSRLYAVTSPQLGRVDLAAVHPAPPYIAGTATWHTEYTMLDAALTDGASEREVPLIVAGDFNASSDLKPFRDLLHRAQLHDAVDSVNGGWQPTFRAGGYPIFRSVTLPPVAQIDHVLMTEQLVPTRVWLTHVLWSDHKAVLTQLRLAAPTS